MIELNVTSAEFHDWKNHVVTKELFKNILDHRAQAVEFITDGGTIEKEFSQQKTARKVGFIEGLDSLLTITIIEEEDDRSSH